MGLFDGFCMVVGKYKGRLLMLKETLSTLCCAPPGTGKTVGVVIPTIFNSHGLSIVVNDPKPELCYSTTGARAKDGPVFVINWGAEDNPAEGIYYPSWNPLCCQTLARPGPDRDMYVDSMCNILVEDPKGGADPHWSKTGRAALTGFIHFIASKCERARANDYFIGRIYEGKLDEEDKRVLEGYYLDMRDPMSARAIQNLRNNNITIDNYLPIGTWQLLPEKWIGHESCLAMILEWITEAQIKQAQDIKRRIEEGDQMGRHVRPDAHHAGRSRRRSPPLRLFAALHHGAEPAFVHAGQRAWFGIVHRFCRHRHFQELGGCVQNKLLRFAI